jgi:hypothetical protein
LRRTLEIVTTDTPRSLAMSFIRVLITRQYTEGLGSAPAI